MTSYDPMTSYDAKAWDEVRRWRDEKLADRGSGTIAERAQRLLVSTGSMTRRRLSALPGADRFEAVFGEMLHGLTDFGARAARASVRTEAVVRAFRKRGYPVQEIADIRTLSLADIDKVKPRLDLAYIASSTVEGAAAGLAVSGGQVLAGSGAALGGAGAAPGAAAVVGVLAADAAAVLMASHRVIAHVAAYYGYDPADPAEQVFALSALNLGTAVAGRKAAAYVELNRVLQGLANRQSWQQLSRSSVTLVVEQVYRQLGVRLTRRKLAQAIPALGVVLGAGLNARLLSGIHDDADHLYRERFLRERYGFDTADLSHVQHPGDTLPLMDIVDAEIVDADILDAEIVEPAPASSATTKPGQAEAVEPAPAKAEPAQAEVVEPAQAEVVEPAPAKAEPAQAEAVDAETAEPQTAEPGTVEPEAGEPETGETGAADGRDDRTTP